MVGRTGLRGTLPPTAFEELEPVLAVAPSALQPCREDSVRQPSPSSFTTSTSTVVVASVGLSDIRPAYGSAIETVAV